MKTKLKTKKSAAKRFKITGTGKITHYQAGRRHLLGAKPANLMRGKKGVVVVHKTDVQAIKELMPYSF